VEGVKAADAEFQKLREELERLTAAVSSIGLNLKSYQGTLVISGLLNEISVTWDSPCNTLHTSQLDVVLWDGHPPLPGVPTLRPAKQLKKLHFNFDLLQSDQHAWVSSDSDHLTFATADLAAFLLKYYMDQHDIAQGGRRA
jgi:hypothetical protein